MSVTYREDRSVTVCTAGAADASQLLTVRR